MKRLKKLGKWQKLHSSSINYSHALAFVSFFHKVTALRITSIITLTPSNCSNIGKTAIYCGYVGLINLVWRLISSKNYLALTSISITFI